MNGTAAALNQAEVGETAQRIAALNTQRAHVGRRIADGGGELDAQAIIMAAERATITGMRSATPVRRRRHLETLGAEVHIADMGGEHVLRLVLMALEIVEFLVRAYPVVTPRARKKGYSRRAGHHYASVIMIQLLS